MSGTKAYIKRKADKRKVVLAKQADIASNRTSLLQMTIAELIKLFGSDKINASHPLFRAIQTSARGAKINLGRLATSIDKFNNKEVKSV